MDTIWIASERTEEAVLNRCERNFNNVFHQNYSGESYISRNFRKRHYSSLTNKILVATNYGSHNSTVSIPTNVRFALSKYNNLSLVGINHTSRHDQVSEDFSELLDGYEDKKMISLLQGAIVSDNLELITQLHHNMVPTVCILHEKTNPKIKNEIQKMAMSGGLFVYSQDEKDEIELYIDAIINRDWNLAITQNGTPKSARILNGLLK